MNLFDFKPEELKALGSGLMDFVIPGAEANQYNTLINPSTWYAEYLHGKSAAPNVSGQYKKVKAGKDRVLVRLDLTAKERSGKEDKIARKSQASPARGPGLTNVHLFDEKSGKLKTERIGVTRGGALKGNINFVVDQSARKATLKSGSKTANTGVVGTNFPKMTEKQIDFLKKKGVPLKYNPMKQNAFTDLGGRVVKPLNGYAWSEGGRVYVLDKNWSKKGVKFYNTLESLPKEIRSNIREGDNPYKFKRKSGLAKGDARSRIGGSPSSSLVRGLFGTRLR
jgi:hypothetical protein